MFRNPGCAKMKCPPGKITCSKPGCSGLSLSSLTYLNRSGALEVQSTMEAEGATSESCSPTRLKKHVSFIRFIKWNCSSPAESYSPWDANASCNRSMKAANGTHLSSQLSAIILRKVFGPSCQNSCQLCFSKAKLVPSTINASSIHMGTFINPPNSLKGSIFL